MMIEEEEFIVELNHENTDLIEDLIFQVPNLYQNNKASYEKKINEIISKKGSLEKDKRKNHDFFLEKITSQFINTLILII